MKLKGKTIMGIVAGIGSLIATGTGIILARKSGELDAQAKTSPENDDKFDDDDVIGDEIVVMEPEDVDEPEEDEEEDE